MEEGLWMTLKFRFVSSFLIAVYHGELGAM